MMEINETDPSVADERPLPSEQRSLRDIKDSLLLPLSELEDDIEEEDDRKKKSSKRKKNKAKKSAAPVTASVPYAQPYAGTDGYAAFYDSQQAPLQPEADPAFAPQWESALQPDENAAWDPVAGAQQFPASEETQAVDPNGGYPYADAQTADPNGGYPYADAQAVDPNGGYQYADAQTADPNGGYPYADAQAVDPNGGYQYADAQAADPYGGYQQPTEAGEYPFDSAAYPDGVSAPAGDPAYYEQAGAEYPQVQTVRVRRGDYLDRASALYVPPQTRPKFQELFGEDRFLSVMSLVSAAACFVWTFVYLIMLAKRDSMFSQMVLQMEMEGHYAFTATFDSPVLTVLKIALFLIPVLAFIWMFSVVHAEKTGAYIGDKKIIFAVIAIFLFIGAMAVFDLAKAGLVFDVTKF